MDSELPLVTIVIPTRNEAQDIRSTLQACIDISYSPKEIIVVDDSTDETPSIVSEYTDQGVTLIHREANTNGVEGARTLGLQEANGEIVVLLNADAVPNQNFLNRVVDHYLDGADILIVRSKVKNTETLWGKYQYAIERSRQLQKGYNPYWSEGFSCRKSAAAAVGFVPGDFPLGFCRDNELSRWMVEAGFEKHFDTSIVMEHTVPDTFRSFWRHRIWRATKSSPHYYFFSGGSVPFIALRETAKAIRSILMDVTVIPLLWRSYRLGHHVGGWAVLPQIAIGMFVDDLAHIRGNFKGLAELVRAVGFKSPPAPPQPPILAKRSN